MWIIQSDADIGFSYHLIGSGRHTGLSSVLDLSDLFCYVSDL